MSFSTATNASITPSDLPSLYERLSSLTREVSEADPARTKVMSVVLTKTSRGSRDFRLVESESAGLIPRKVGADKLHRSSHYEVTSNGEGKISVGIRTNDLEAVLQFIKCVDPAQVPVAEGGTFVSRPPDSNRPPSLSSSVQPASTHAMHSSAGTEVSPGGPGTTRSSV